MRILSKQFNITLRQSNIILNTPLKTLSKNSKQELKDLHDNIIVKKDKLSTSLTSIDNTILGDVERISKQYKRTNYISRIPKYKGYISVDDSFLIQYESDYELTELLQTFKNKYINIFKYDKKPKYILDYPNKISMIVSDKKYRVGYRYIDVQNIKIFNKSRATLVVNKLKVNSDNLLINNKLPVLYVNNRYVIKKDNLSNIKDRILFIKNINRSDEEFLVITFNSNIKNKLRFQCIKVDTLPKKILAITSKKNVTILDVIKLSDKTDSYILNIPFQYSSLFRYSYYNLNISDKIKQEPFIEKRPTFNLSI